MPGEDKKDLVDIRSVSVAKGMPQDERNAEYVRQLRDPYRFLCGDFKVTAAFDKNGPTITECFRSLCGLAI